MQCTWCGKQLKTTRQGMLRHITRFCDVTKTLSQIERWMKAVSCAYDERLADRAWLERRYHAEKQSALDIAREIGCDKLMVYRALDKHGITKRTLSEARQLAQLKTEATCLERYGATNPLGKGTKPERRRNQTVKERYGVVNVFQRPDIKEANIRNMSSGGAGNVKRLDNLQRRFGTRSPFGRPEVRAKINASFLGGAHGRYISNLNRRAYEVLTKHNVEFEAEFMIGALSYDVRIGRTLIELNGDHPHANPSRFSANDVILMPGQRYIAADIWERDARKARLAGDNGFRFVTLWESDLKEDFENVLMGAVR